MRALLIVLLLLSVNVHSADKAQAPTVDKPVHISNPAANPDTNSADQKNNTERPTLIKLIPADDAEHAKQDANNEEEEKLSFERDGVFLNKLIAVFTGILALITLGIFLVAGLTMIRDLRAYVMVDDKRLTNVTIGEQPHAEFTIKNFGRTPAKNVMTWFKIHFVKPSDSTDFPFQITNDDGSRGILPPGGTSIIGDTLKIEYPEVIPFSFGTGWRLFVVGKIEYTDIFKFKRITTFKIEHRPEWGNDHGDVGLRWSSSGNEYK